MSNFGKVSLLVGSNKINLFGRSGLAASYDIYFPNTAPANNQVLKWDSGVGAFVWGVGSGTLDSSTAALTVTDNGGGSYTLSYPSSPANTFLAAPSGGAGLPVFRTIVDADISALDASKLTGTIAAARMPSGTNASSWQIGVASLNPKVVAASTSVLELRKNDNSLADLVVNKITATQVDFTNVSEIPVGDNTIVLNADYTGSTPTEDSGIETERGTLTNSFIGWQESTDRYVAGFVGTLYQLAIKTARNVVSGDLTGSNLVWTHNLGTTDICSFSLFNASSESISVGYTVTNSNTITVDMTGLTVTGTWRAVLTA